MTKITIRAYNIGFGDCFLLKFPYSNSDGGDRFILIDFGTSSRPKKTKTDLPVKIAKDIKAQCNGHLHAVVVTHRHKDHLSGFSTKRTGIESGDIIASLKPDLVVQPWTEDPELPTDATSPKKIYAEGLNLGLNFVKNIYKRVKFLRNLQDPKNLQLVEEIKFLGRSNIANKSAVDKLIEMAKGDKGEYVHYGSETRLNEILPGVEVHVLGPPTIEQSEEVQKQRSKDATEYWHMQNTIFQSLTPSSVSKDSTPPLFPLFPDVEPISKEKLSPDSIWFADRVKTTHLEQIYSIVRILDRVLNNTSVILLFEFGDKKLLFSGDAQIENWEYALAKPEIRKLLADVNFYKVGHHGSLNATPKILWDLFKNRNEDKDYDNRLICLLSTKKGKHGSFSRGTEVPRGKLLKELKENSNLIDTQEIELGDLYTDINIG